MPRLLPITRFPRRGAFSIADPRLSRATKPMVLLRATPTNVSLVNFDEIAVAESFGVIENGDDRRRDPEHRGDRGRGRRPSRVFGIAFQENVVGAIDLRSFGDWRCLSCERKPLDVERISEITRNRHRNTWVAGNVR